MKRTTEVTKDCFNALAQLREAGHGGQLVPEVLHDRMLRSIDAMVKKAKEVGLDARDVSDLTYAIVALADEVVLRTSDRVREFWMSRPLQLHYFNETLAGEGFFRRLDEILTDPSRLEVLEIYYLCLLYGFRGKYAASEPDLSMVERRVQEALGRQIQTEPLSTAHLRPREVLRAGSAGVVALWSVSFVFVFALCLLLVLKISLDEQAEAVVQKANAMVGGS